MSARDTWTSEPYAAMAPIYDRINESVPYDRWADFIEAAFARFCAQKPSLVLDLAAGSGSMTIELARRGYDLIAVDRSGEMLSLAAERVRNAKLPGILLLEQDMTDFELYGTVDAAVCCLDSINHLTARGALGRCLSLLHNYLNPDGLFLFDVNTPWKFANVYGQNDFILDAGDSVCCWRNDYDAARGVCDFGLTIFTRRPDGGSGGVFPSRTAAANFSAHARHAAARFARRRSRPATAFGDAHAKAGSGFQCNTQSRRRSSSISFSSPRKASRSSR